MPALRAWSCGFEFCFSGANSCVRMPDLPYWTWKSRFVTIGQKKSLPENFLKRRSSSMSVLTKKFSCVVMMLVSALVASSSSSAFAQPPAYGPAITLEQAKKSCLLPRLKLRKTIGLLRFRLSMVLAIWWHSAAWKTLSLPASKFPIRKPSRLPCSDVRRKSLKTLWEQGTPRSWLSLARCPSKEACRFSLMEK